MKKIAFSIVLMLAFCVSCGYQIGRLGHPQIQSVAVALCVNETVEANVISYMRQYCAEQIQTDGTYVLENLGSGDCELHTRVISIQSYALASTSTDNETRFRERAYQVVVDVEYSLIMPGRVEPILTGNVKGRERYQVFLDVQTNRDAAIRQACRDACVQIVHEIATAW